MNWLTELLPSCSFSAPSFPSPIGFVLHPQSPQLWSNSNFSCQQSSPSLNCHSSKTRLFPRHQYSPLLQSLPARQRALKVWDMDKFHFFIYKVFVQLFSPPSFGQVGSWNCECAALPYKSGLGQTFSGSPCTVAPGGQYWICKGMEQSPSHSGEHTVAGWQFSPSLDEVGLV